MAVKTKAGDEAPIPGPDTFNFEDYISGKSTFPEFTHTVYLDQASGIALANIVDEYDTLAKRGRSIIRRQGVMAEMSSASLVDEEVEKLAEELDEIESRTAELEKEITDLEEKVKASGLTLVFQVGTAQKLGKVVRRAEKEYNKRHGKGADDDAEYITGKARHVLIAQLVGYCTKIILPNGEEQKPPGEEGFGRLLDSLISSESVRLLTALNRSLDSSGKWAERVDAGFPGGGADVGDGTVGSADPEDGPVLVGSAADAHDREED